MGTNPYVKTDDGMGARRRTANEWRTMAAENRQYSRESWERSDTDGFVSQWASDTTAREYDAWAKLAEDDYMGEFEALYMVDGRLVEGARNVETRFGYAWAIPTATGTQWFNPSNARKGATRRRNDERKGFVVGTVKREAYVTLAGSGKGLSGAMSVRPVVLPVKDAPALMGDSKGTEYYGTDW